MAAITSTTESWHNHSFSEVESHIKGKYVAGITKAQGTMSKGTNSDGSVYFYLSMTPANAKKCTITWCFNNAYTRNSNEVYYHAGNGYDTFMPVKYVSKLVYGSVTITNAWVVTTGGFDPGSVYYSYILIG